MVESRIEEAISAGMVQQLHAVHTAHPIRVKSVVKYSSQESAPSHHGLFVELESGERFEITIQRR